MSQSMKDNIHFVCQTCKNRHTGKVCNLCGEKVFSQEQLSAKHFFHQVIDFFYHWENKVLKSLKLNFFNPGWITKENINGIRVPYAKPVQMYLVAAFIFFFVVKSLNVRDYIPSFGDHRFGSLSSNEFLKWAEPLDLYIESGIDSMWTLKGIEMQKELETSYAEAFSNGKQLFLPGRKTNPDTLITDVSKIPVLAFRSMILLRSKAYDDHVALLGKSMIFVLIPIIALVFFLVFYKKIKYYGVSLLLATHFMVYNLLIYTGYQLLNRIPQKLGWCEFTWMYIPFDYIFYNDYTGPITTFILGHNFCFLHVMFFAPWLFIAFKRLFKTHWFVNVIVSVTMARLFYFLIFGLYKKILIAYTVYSLHL